MKPFFLILSVAIPFLAVAGCSSKENPLQPEPDPIEYTLIWQDEFEGPIDQSPDANKWAFDVGGSGWGNNQLEYDTDRPENVSLDGSGNLRIIARKESYQGKDYTSGRIKTQGKFAHTYGRFEARIKLPVGQGMWPAFWLLGSDITTVGWPKCGEIDIMEYRGQNPSTVSGALHGPGYSGGNPLYGVYNLPNGGFNEGFHLFAVEWTKDKVTWSVDGIDYMIKTNKDIPRGTDWVFDHDFFIILNLAVGGNFVGPPNSSTVFPQTMLIDYVRVYGES